MDNLKAVLEGILFLVGEEGISLAGIRHVLETDETTTKELINKLKEEYESENRGVQLVYLGNKYKLTTKPGHSKYYERLIDSPNTNILSQAALETLIIIAYNGPITRSQIEEIRGVNSDGIVVKLLARGLIKEVGRADTPGRPTLYSVTDEFLDHFNLSSLDDLPKLEEFTEDEIRDEVDLFMSKYQENNNDNDLENE